MHNSSLIRLILVLFQSSQVRLEDFLAALSKAVDQQFKEKEDLTKD